MGTVWLLFDPRTLPEFLMMGCHIESIPPDSPCRPMVADWFSAAKNGLRPPGCPASLRKDSPLIMADCFTMNDKRKMMAFLVNLLNFTTAVNVQYEKTYVERHRRKEAEKLSTKSKKLPSAYYEIRFQTRRTGEGKPHHEGARNSPRRHWVRGHFKFYTKGPKSGRSIWCPPHQRGSGETIIRKVYRA